MVVPLSLPASSVGQRPYFQRGSQWNFNAVCKMAEHFFFIQLYDLHLFDRRSRPTEIHSDDGIIP